MRDQDLAESLLKPENYALDVAGKLRKVKHVMWALESKLGEQLWITLILEIVDFQEWLIENPGRKVKAARLPAAMKAVSFYGERIKGLAERKKA